MSRNSDIAQSFNETRKSRQEYRAGLAECYQCNTKNYPEAEYCRNCGSPNQNYRPACRCLKCKRAIQSAADVCGEAGCPVRTAP